MSYLGQKWVCRQARSGADVDARTINSCAHLLFVAKNLERIGDHATNIAETVHYLITGEPLVDERPKKDTTSTTSVEYVEK